MNQESRLEHNPNNSNLHRKIATYVKVSAIQKLYIPSTYSKQRLSTVAHTNDCIGSRILNHCLNHWLLFSLSKFLG